MKTYLQLNVKIYSSQDGRDIVLAVLSNCGFESFVEHENRLEAYINEAQWNASFLDELVALSLNGIDLSWSIQAIPPENWNAVWESDFNPIIVGKQCAVRAHFHAPIDVLYELIITPKMSFGTGHHQTTYMMLDYLLKYPPKNHNVLDMGSGTGVLAILAEKLGATQIEALDIEPWCFENTLENTQHNFCTKVAAMQGDSSKIPHKTYQTILANINMNVLLIDIPLFSSRLEVKGKLFLSGFFQQDLPAIEAKCFQNGLKLIDYTTKNNWVAAHFEKIDG